MMKRKHKYYAIGSLIIAFILGTMLVLPLFNRKSLLSHLETYFEGDIDKNVSPLGVGWQDNDSGLGWEFLDNNTVFHMWNTFNDYYFNASNGVQFSNHYNEYWTCNVLMLGYYDGDSWNLIYRTDELTGFNHNILNVSEEINVTLWKDLNYASYDFRLALRYHLGANDSDLTIIPYIKNLGIAIPYNIGFGWEMKDIQIANVSNDNYLRIFNGTGFEDILLNQSLDESFTDMDLNTSINLICKNPPSPYLSRNLYLRWDSNLTYKVTCKSRTGQYNAPCSLFIRVGTLDVEQEKYTIMNWLDADDWLGISSAEYDSHCGDSAVHTPEEALDGTDYWGHYVNEVHWLVLDLGQTYTIKKVRGRSDRFGDPIDVNIYIDDSNPPTTLCEEGISTWQDTENWVEITLTTEGTGRYIKIEIEATENVDNSLTWGQSPSPFTIFDAYGDVAGGANTAPTVSGESVWDGTTNHSFNATCVLIPPTSWNVTLNDPEGDKMTWTVRTNQSGIWQDVNSSGNLANGTYSNHTNTSWVDTRATKYWLSYNITDGTDWTNQTFWIWTCNWTISQQWTSNFSFSNTSRLQQQWNSNFSFSNTINLEQQWNSNFSFSNTSQLEQQWTSNFSFSNTSLLILYQQWTSNFSFSNSTVILTLEQQWTSNFSFSNGTLLPEQQWSSTFSFSNSSMPTVIIIPVHKPDYALAFVFALLFFAFGFILGKKKIKRKVIEENV